MDVETENLTKLITVSTIRMFDFKLEKLGDTLWQIRGSLPYVAITLLDRSGYLFYMIENEFFISKEIKKDD